MQSVLKSYMTEPCCTEVLSCVLEVSVRIKVPPCKLRTLLKHVVKMYNPRPAYRIAYELASLAVI